MPVHTTVEELIAQLRTSDPQFDAAIPSPEVTAAADRPGLRLPELIDTVLAGYANRPALGQRRIEFTRDAETGRTIASLQQTFETVTYQQLSDRVEAVTKALAGNPVKPGDRVATLGFTSIDYTALDLALTHLGAVAVPLQSSASAEQLQPIVAETEPTLIASSITCLAEATELALNNPAIQKVVVFDFHPEVDDDREALAEATTRISAAGSPVVVRTLADEITTGLAIPGAIAGDGYDTNPLALLVYTSGSTGAPKGAMHEESSLAAVWRAGEVTWDEHHGKYPEIILSFMPMSHVMGRQSMYSALSVGGTVYFAATADLSSFLEDLALVRPTQLLSVPRVWEMIYQEVQSAIDVQIGADSSSEAQLLAEQYRTVVGGRCVMASTGSAPISPDLKDWVEAFLGIHLTDMYGSTEGGVVIVDGQVRRPLITDYKLVDVPELGYHTTDMPHPRGELLMKVARPFAGYYLRPDVTAAVFDEDGFYRTGDIFAEVAPETLKYVDRRNNVLKLSQGEFVTLARLEVAFGDSPLIHQIYPFGKSTQPYLLAVVVPTEEALAQHSVEALKPMIAASLQETAAAAGLQSYEMPRDFIIETTPFTVDNGLLTGIRKLAWPKLKAHYGAALEQMYIDLADGQADQLRALRRHGAEAPTLETVTRAAGALLGTAETDLLPTAHFTDLGGDSLSALTFATLLGDIYSVDVPVNIIVSPASDLQAIAQFIDAQRAGETRPTFASVHGAGATEVHASDLSLDKFIDAATLAAAPDLPRPAQEIRTVLLTGTTGFLGRYLALDWLERMSLVDGKVICLVRARDDAAARARMDATFNGADPELWAHYQTLAADHLEVIAGDKGDENLGLDQQTWQRLADTVDLIVDPAALVNHVLPYSALFGPNALGTAELIKIALTTRLKPFIYTSTIAVGAGIEPGKFAEAPDVRTISATRAVDESYANGYGNSKWAGEVLLREAHDLCGLPATVFRCDMILADTTWSGQLNLPDMFTRLMLSIAATGIAPRSFYELDADGNTQRAHYDGLPVEFIAEAISTLGVLTTGFDTYHVMNPYDDGIGLDEIVDWIVAAGHPVRRIDDYSTWVQRFETAMRALPEHQRQYSSLPLMHSMQQPDRPFRGSIAPTDRFHAAVQEAKIGPEKDIPHITAELIAKYMTNLQLVGLL